MQENWRPQYHRYRSFFLNIYELYKRREDFRIFLELALTLTTISVFLVFALKPTIVTIIELVKDIKAKEETIAQLDNKLQNLKKAQSIMSENQNQLAVLELAIPDSPEPFSFTRQVEAAAAVNQASLSGIAYPSVTLAGDISLKTKSKKDNFPAEATALVFSGSFGGPYENLVNLLTNLENTRRPIRFDAIAIGKQKSKESETETINLSVTGRIPYLLGKTTEP